MEEFARFYEQSKDGVLRAVVAATGDPHAAEDAAVEAFTRACARWERLRRHPNPTAWVALTALNVQRSRWRRLWREQAGVPDLPAAIAAEPLNDELVRLIRGLPRRQREVLVLRVVIGVDTDDLARVLGISPATVRVHLHRALATLRAAIEPRWQEAG